MRPTSVSVTVQLLFFLMFLSVTTASTTDVPLPLSDRVAIQKLLEQFRKGWVSGNADAVRNTFASDAVLMPHHGVPPVVGTAAIKEFW
jgi:hypothetical protein